MTWQEWLRALAPAAPLAAALIILIGVVFTGAVTVYLAGRRNRHDKQIADDRIDHDRRQAALDRTYTKRAEVYLESVTWLSAVERDLADPFDRSKWDSEAWWQELRHRERELVNQLKVYGRADAADLLEKASGSFRAAAEKYAHHLQRTDSLQIDGLDELSALDARRYAKQAWYEAGDYLARGRHLRTYFEQLCQADLADEDYTIPTESVKIDSWFQMLERNNGAWPGSNGHGLTRTTDGGWTDEPARAALEADLDAADDAAKLRASPVIDEKS